jgi:DNA-directed RNA polymerase specialized sigma24 family protein
VKTSVPVPERVAIRTLYLSGLKVPEIAAQLGYTRSAIARALMTSNAYGSPRGR